MDSLYPIITMRISGSLHDTYKKFNLVNHACIVDANHNNSGKKFIEQPRIVKEIIHSRNYDSEIKNLVKGVMVESYIEDGNQPVDGGCYGKSITDPCLGWDKTETTSQEKLQIFCKKYILSLRAYTITRAVLIQHKKTGGSIMIPPVFFIYLSGRSLAEFDEYASSQRHISHHLIFTCSIRIHRIDNSSQKS